MPGPDDDTIGDFASLKQFRTDLTDLQQFLIRAYQYVIARFDIDGFRIDTLRYLEERPASAVRQLHSGICAQHRQEELLHLRRSFRG